MAENGAIIHRVEPDSIAAELLLEPGDRILSVNGAVLEDYIDFLMANADERISLEVLKKKNGAVELLEIEKDAAESLGVSFENVVFDGIRECANHCLFCFVHQLPARQRATLYIRDDDYRLSFLHGAYITFTNLTESDWRRIERLHLSPLYVSVHATDPAVRQKLLGVKGAAPILEQIKRLVAAGITVHTQAVICPEINDGPVLEQTIQDLAQFWPEVASLAIVPVGLTEHRSKLFPLRIFRPDEASRVIDLVHRFQKQFRESLGSRFVFAADEWYVLAGRQVPEDEAYEDYLQLDNGVGLLRWFLTDFYETFPSLYQALSRLQGKLVVITGQAAIGMWEEVRRYWAAQNLALTLELLPVQNRFLGSTVTVTGLLSGNDVMEAIQSHQPADQACYLVPQITLRQGDDLFLDGVSVAQLREACAPKRVMIVPTQAAEWLRWIIHEGCVDGCLEQSLQ
jgi:putative radical SAM enzyme (TIGR03279 family)